MTLNPITALSDLFSKVVVEHGSAIVQEKHIALLKEQFSILEKENLVLALKVENLESEKQILKVEIADQSITIEKLNGTIRELDKDKKNKHIPQGQNRADKWNPFDDL